MHIMHCFILRYWVAKYAMELKGMTRQAAAMFLKAGIQSSRTTKNRKNQKQCLWVMGKYALLTYCLVHHLAHHDIVTLCRMHRTWRC